MSVPINNVPRRVVYAASGTGPYAFTFEILANTDIAVYKDDTLLTLTTDYSVTIADNGTGSISLVTSPVGATQIAIVGNRTIERTSDFVTGGDFFANTVNDELDQQTIFAQQNAEGLARSLQAPQTDPTSINMVLPRATDRANKYLAFDASGNPLPGATAVEITEISAIADEIVIVSAIAANVTTVAGVSANVTTVAGISSAVSGVSAISSAVSAVNSNATNINTVATDLAGSDTVGTVAGIAANVTTVAGISTDVTAVAGDATDIGTVATDLAGSNTIGAVAAIAANVATVAGIATDVTAVAGVDADDLAAVAGVAADVTAVAGISADVVAVENIAANVTTVAGIAANVTAVAGISAAVTGVNTISSAVSAVNSNATNVNTVAGISANVTTVAGISANIGTVAGISANVTTVAGISSAISTAATNVADITNFADVYIGPSASDPTTRADSSALQAGDLYFDTSADAMKVYTGSAWTAAYISAEGYMVAANNLSDLTNAITARTNLGLGTAATTASGDYATAAQGALADSALQSADIGTTVQAYDATLLNDADIGSTVQAYDATILVDADIGTTVASTAANTFTDKQTMTAVKITTGAGAAKVLTSDAYGDATWETVAPGAGVATATASGALANGDLVVVNADGTVSVVAGASVTQAIGTAVVFKSANSEYMSATYDSNAQKVVIAYLDGNSSYGTAIVGTVSGTSISFGTAVVFQSASSNHISATYDSNAQKVVIAYRDGGNSEYGTAIVGTVSGTSISFGTAVVFESVFSYNMSATYDANAQKVVIAYTDNGNSDYGTAIVGTVSGTSISFGTAVVFESANSSNISATYDANAQKVVIAYMDNGNSQYGTVIVGTVSGTVISFGTAVVFQSASSNNISATYDSNAQKVVIAYRDGGNSEYGTAIVGAVSGTSISFGTAVVFESATSVYMSATYDSNAQKVVITYRDDGNSYYGTVIVGTVSGTSISFGTAVVFESDYSIYISATYDANAQKVVIAYRDGGNSTYGTSVVLQNAFVSTNLTATNYIGISDAIYSDTATATIQTVGSVDDAQSSLTAGTAYYVQRDGTLATTADTISVLAGTALSATKLIIKG